MRAALRYLFFATCAASPALAGPCSGADTQLAQISRHLTLNSLDGVKPALEALSRAYPDCSEILLQQARLAQAKEIQISQPISITGTPTAIRTTRKGSLISDASFSKQRDYMRADALSAAAVERNPEDPVALALRGQVLVMKGEQSEGQGLLEKAVQLDADDPEAQFQLGAIYDKAKSVPTRSNIFAPW